MKKLIKKSIAALFAALCVSVLAINAFASENPTLSADGLHTCYIKVDRNYDLAYEVLEIVNKERDQLGIGPVTMNKTLLDAAIFLPSNVRLKQNAVICSLSLFQNFNVWWVWISIKKIIC